MNLPAPAFNSLPLDLGIAVAIGLIITGLLFGLFWKSAKAEGKRLSKTDFFEKAVAPGLVALLIAFTLFTFAAGVRHDNTNSERVNSLQTQVAERYDVTLNEVQTEQLLNATPTPVGENSEGVSIILYGSTQTWSTDSSWLQGVFLYQEGDTFKLAFQGGAANIVELPLNNS